MNTKSNTIAVAAILTALATSGVTVPAFAKDNQAPGFDTCFALSVERGSGPNKGGGTKEDSQNKAFIAQCMAGKIPGNLAANPSVAKLPANAHASSVHRGQPAKREARP
jgi:hypothetical protein